eukprot:3270383-Alexandrium_andersonii.AAC.1
MKALSSSNMQPWSQAPTSGSSIQSSAEHDAPVAGLGAKVLLVHVHLPSNDGVLLVGTPEGLAL